MVVCIRFLGGGNLDAGELHRKIERITGLKINGVTCAHGLVKIHLDEKETDKFTPDGYGALEIVEDILKGYNFYGDQKHNKICHVKPFQDLVESTTGIKARIESQDNDYVYIYMPTVSDTVLSTVNDLISTKVKPDCKIETSKEVSKICIKIPRIYFATGITEMLK